VITIAGGFRNRGRASYCSCRAGRSGRLEFRPAASGYRRALANGSTFNEWGFIEPPEYFSSTAAEVRAAFRR